MKTDYLYLTLIQFIIEQLLTYSVMKRILFPNHQKYLLVLTGVSSNNYSSYPEKREINFSSRINQFTANEKLLKYKPSFSELEELMEYRQSPSKDAGTKEVKNLDTLIRMTRLNKNKYSNKYNLGVWLAASSIILIVVLAAIIRNIETREISEVYNAFFTIPTSALAKNLGDLSNPTEWNNAVTSYESMNFPVAIDNFALIPSGTAYFDYAIFYKGICFTALNQFSKAIETFESVSPSSDIYNQTKYYIGLCNLKLNRINTAREIFSELTISAELAKNAKEILLKLESID